MKTSEIIFTLFNYCCGVTKSISIYFTFQFKLKNKTQRSIKSTPSKSITASFDRLDAL